MNWNQAIAAITENQGDMRELISKWADMLDPTPADVVFEMFDGSVYTIPNFAKIANSLACSNVDNDTTLYGGSGDLKDVLENLQDTEIANTSAATGATVKLALDGHETRLDAIDTARGSYTMDQDVETTDSPTFDEITLSSSTGGLNGRVVNAAGSHLTKSIAWTTLTGTPATGDVDISVGTLGSKAWQITVMLSNWTVSTWYPASLISDPSGTPNYDAYFTWYFDVSAGTIKIRDRGSTVNHSNSQYKIVIGWLNS
jgi:hypothetical protein